MYGLSRHQRNVLFVVMKVLIFSWHGINEAEVNILGKPRARQQSDYDSILLDETGSLGHFQKFASWQLRALS
jgi:hypothetical protein